MSKRNAIFTSILLGTIVLSSCSFKHEPEASSSLAASPSSSTVITDSTKSEASSKDEGTSSKNEDTTSSQEQASSSSKQEESVTSSSSKEDETSSSSEAGGKDLDTFNDALRSSKPTKVKTNWTYTYEKYGVVLHATSILLIEYGNSLKASYSLTKEVLNPTDSSEFISEKTSKWNYPNGTSSNINDSDWNESIEPSFAFSNYSLTDGTFKYGKYTISGGTLKGTIDNGELPYMLGGNCTISDMEYTLKINQNKVSSVYASYLTSSKAKVDMNSTYTYYNETVSV